MMLAFDQDVGPQIGVVSQENAFRRDAAVGHQKRPGLSRHDQLKDERLVVRAGAFKNWGWEKDARRDFARKFELISGLAEASSAFRGGEQLDEVSMKQ